MSNFTNQLGNWNPQLLREYQGRLKSRSIIAAIVLSAIAQILLLVFNLPDRAFEELTLQERWLDLWENMTWVISYALFAIGSYYLVSDLTQEEQRGTLNFIRLTPYPTWKILLGKLLGVPVLPCLTVALAIPLHFVAAIQARLPLALFFSFYLLLLAGCIFLYSAAMLCGLAGGVQIRVANRQTTTAIIFTAIALFIFTPLFMFWNIASKWQWMSRSVFGSDGFGKITWYGISITDNVGFAHLFTLSALAAGTAIAWSILLRRFRQPRSTLMSKRQSYLIVAVLEGLLLGFFVSANRVSPNEVGTYSFVMAAFSVAIILLLTLSICPSRQALIDWKRYRSQGWQSRVWADKSPITIAVLLQILIAAALILPWLFLYDWGGRYTSDIAIAFLVIANILLIYSLLVQLIFASKIRNPLVWAIGALTIGIAVPPTILRLLQWNPQGIDGAGFVPIWTFFGYPFWEYGDRNHLLFAALGVVLQWIVLAGLLLKFRRTLRRLNVSAAQPIEPSR